ncbi:arylsulfatase [Rubritalea halochordaticola]|uniref:Arylsulfatase n=1 Tax=Rubritalea halochordaticola TaxID=714537 RepID=A0ABP9V3U9_9BACT
MKFSKLLRLSALLLVPIVAKAADKPNILLIYADDHGYTDIASMGSDFYETPNLDKLKSQSLSFTNGYASCANCAPSRASLMSGVYSARHKVYTVGSSARGKSSKRKLIPIKNVETLDPKFTTLPEAMKAAGYATCHAGKWHVSGDPTKYGFDKNFGGNHAGGPYTGKGYFSPYNNPNLPDGPVGEHLPDRLSREVNGWINEQHKADKPFFAYMAFYSVHTPIQARKDLAEKYEAKEKGENHKHAKYAAMVEAMDQAIGNLLNNLEEQGLADNTIVVFTTDNGPFGGVSNAKPLRGVKGMFYEGGIRVPFFVRWPGKSKAGSSSDIPVHQTDLFPTLAMAGGAELPETLDGVNLVDVVEGKELPSRALFWHFPCYLQGSYDGAHTKGWRATPCSVIREGDWKLVQYFEDDSVELFNLKEDLSESKDLSKTNPRKVTELLAKLKAWQEASGADIPTEKNPDYGKPEAKKEKRKNKA